MSIIIKSKTISRIGKLELGLLISLFGFLYVTGMGYYGGRLIHIPGLNGLP